MKPKIPKTGGIVITIFVVILSYLTFFEDVIFTQIAFFPLSIILLLSCIFSTLGLLSICLKRDRLSTIFVVLSFFLWLLNKYYPVLFLKMKLLN